MRLIDLLVIGAVILVVWLVMKKPKANEGEPQTTLPIKKPTTSDTQTGWERLRTQPDPSGETSTSSNVSAASDGDDDFLRGAKVFYIRIQEAEDRRDFNDVAAFVAPSVLANLESQANAKTTTDKTEILLLKAEVKDMRTEGTITQASVLFESLQKQGSSESGKENVRGLWRFTRDESQPRALWTLIAIEDVEKLPVQ